MRLAQTLSIDGNHVKLTISEADTGREIGDVVWKGAARYVRETGAPKGYTQILIPTTATLEIKPK